jgi:glc operon protein GlcG
MLTLDVMKQIASHAGQTAAAIRCAMSIVIVDSGANLAYLERMDDAMIGSVDAAHRKARCAVLFKRPTKVFEDMLAGGRTAVLSLPGVMPIEGGIPLLIDGQFAGGIGVSGGTSQQDGMVATAAAESLAEILGRKSA